MRISPGELDKWGQIGCNGHFNGDYPWLHIDEYANPEMTRVVGAEKNEVR
jgi:kynureninase